MNKESLLRQDRIASILLAGLGVFAALKWGKTTIPSLVFLGLSDWSFLVLPTLVGVCLLVLVGWVYGRVILHWVRK